MLAPLRKYQPNWLVTEEKAVKSCKRNNEFTLKFRKGRQYINSCNKDEHSTNKHAAATEKSFLSFMALFRQEVLSIDSTGK